MPRFYIGHTEDEREIWRATSVAMEANRLITVDLDKTIEGAPQRYRAALVALAKNASGARNLAPNTWVFDLDLKLNEVFQMLVDHLGTEHHSYTAVDLRSGEGLSYDPQNRIICEFYSKNWLA